MKINEIGSDVEKPRLVMQKGFSLVELLVALVIGLIIILGAGQLFLSGFLNFRQVQILGEKQAALTYGSEVLLRDIRRAKLIPPDPDVAGSDYQSSLVWDSTDGELSLIVENRGDGVCDPDQLLRKKYWVEVGSLYVDVTECLDALVDVYYGGGYDPGFTQEPVVSGFAPGGFQAAEDADTPGVWLLAFDVLSDARNAGASESVVFRVVNRTTAMQSFDS